MARDHWDAILASSPLNATAGAVTGKGVHFEPTAVNPETSWDAPPQMVSITKEQCNSASFTNLTGLRAGRLTVIGLAQPQGNGDRGLWVCRCVCGRYVGRRAKGLKSNPDAAMCNQCNYSRHLQYAASGNRARERAESEKARKWTLVETEDEGKPA